MCDDAFACVQVGLILGPQWMRAGRVLCAVSSQQGLPGHPNTLASLRSDAAALTVPFGVGDGSMTWLLAGPWQQEGLSVVSLCAATVQE